MPRRGSDGDCRQVAEQPPDCGTRRHRPPPEFGGPRTIADATGHFSAFGRGARRIWTHPVGRPTAANHVEPSKMRPVAHTVRTTKIAGYTSNLSKNAPLSVFSFFSLFFSFFLLSLCFPFLSSLCFFLAVVDIQTHFR